MKYKLKEHVTEEQLVERGFKVSKNSGDFINYAIRQKNDEDRDGIFIRLSSPFPCELMVLVFNYGYERRHDDITPYIQDLIDLDYVEVVE